MSNRAVRLLLVTPVSPFSSASGSEQRSALFLEAMQAIGTVDVLQLAPGAATRVWRDDADAAFTAPHAVLRAEVGNADGLQRYRPKVDLTAAVQRALGKPLSHYDLIAGRYLWSLCQLVLPAGVPTLIDLDDFRYRYGKEAGWSLPLLKERSMKAVNYRLARRQLHRFDAAFVVSERDKALMNGLPSQLLTNVPWSTPDQVTPVPTNKRVLFVGSLWYRPNADGIDWFLAKVWPNVRAAVPEATLQLVGPAPSPRRAGWERHEGVSAPGFVDDLGAAYAAASLVVVPVHSGGGTNIKVLEALAHGRPCLVTDLVQKPFSPDLLDGLHLASATSPDDFATAAVSLLRDTRAAAALAAAGLEKVKSRFHRSMMQRTLQEFAHRMLLWN